MLETFGIFEGGGAKGLAHIGALKAAEERRVRFVGVAGTSAGAIVAALVAAGFCADELYDPQAPADEPKGLFDKDFLQFFDRTQWQRLVALKRDAERTFQGIGPVRAWWRAPCFYRRNKPLIDKLASDRGVFTTTVFMQWLDELLATKVTGTGPGGTVLFRDMRIPLKIVATDIVHETVKVFGSANDETPTERVSAAVAASISIPFFFLPYSCGTQAQRTELVDGGLISNFPAWVFDAERLKVGTLMPTLGFRLVERNLRGPIDPSKFLGFAARLFTTALSGDGLLEVRQVANLQVIPLRVKASTFDFDMGPETKENLYRDGLNDTRSFFLRYVGPRNPEEAKPVLPA